MSTFQKYMNGKKVCDFTGMSRSKIWKLRQNKAFPEPLKENGITLGWTEEQIANWQQAQLNQASSH